MFCENFQLMGGGWVGSTKRCKSKWRKERKNSSECRWKFKTLWIFYRLLRKNWVIFEPPTSHLRTHALFILKRENIGLFCIKRDISNSISCSSSKQRKREIVPSHKPDGNISHVHTHTQKPARVYFTVLMQNKAEMKCFYSSKSKTYDRVLTPVPSEWSLSFHSCVKKADYRKVGWG